MPWLKVTTKFDFMPKVKKGKVMQDFYPNEVRLVTSPCLAFAVSKGFGVVTDRPADGKEVLNRAARCRS